MKVLGANDSGQCNDQSGGVNEGVSAGHNGHNGHLKSASLRVRFRARYTFYMAQVRGFI